MSESRRDFRGREHHVQSLDDQTNQEQSRKGPNRHKHLPMTPEELKALRECNRESFWYRCVPLTAVAVIATRYGLASGYLKPNPRFGGALKYMGATFAGYVIGKWSYFRKCQDKLLALPNSPLADQIRKRKGVMDTLQDLDPQILPTEPHTQMQESYQNMDGDASSTDLPSIQGLDDSRRPTLDSSDSLPSEDANPVTQQTTYGDLRKQHRADFYSESECIN